MGFDWWHDSTANQCIWQVGMVKEELCIVVQSSNSSFGYWVYIWWSLVVILA
jgi:hypothetical protein